MSNIDIVKDAQAGKAYARNINTKKYVEQYLEANTEDKAKIKAEYVEIYLRMFDVGTALADLWGKKPVDPNEQKQVHKISEQLAEREFAKGLKAYTGTFVEKIKTERETQSTEIQR